MSKILCAGSAGRQLKLRNTSSSIALPCAEEEARIWKLSRRREDRLLPRAAALGCHRGQGAVQPVPKLSVQDFVRMDPR
nr:unnamed protein product [Callosobruchus chinensis]